jgi:hypothetical protein
MDLFGQLFFTKFVESVEFLGQDNVLLETTTSQFYTDNDSSVWNHHSYCTEVDLQIFWQLLTTSITWVLKIGKIFPCFFGCIRTFNLELNATYIINSIHKNKMKIFMNDNGALIAMNPSFCYL